VHFRYKFEFGSGEPALTPNLSQKYTNQLAA
jgi:hypothetical protein